MKKQKFYPIRKRRFSFRAFTPHLFHSKRCKGFTMIEILLVIGIIGLLASITLVVANEAREKASRANVINFAAQIHHALGAYAKGIWDFEEGPPAGTATDSSGNGNNGTINGATWTDDTPSKKGYALSFDGDGDYVEVGDVNLLSGATQFTIMYWVKPGRDLQEEPISWYGGVGELTEYSLGWQGWTDGVTVDFYDTSGTRHFTDTWDQYLLKDQWYHIVGVYDGAYLKVYINGELIRQEYEGSFTVRTSTNTLRIGYCQGYWNGIIDDVRIYSEAFSLGQIKKIYAQGLKRHELSVK